MNHFSHSSALITPESWRTEPAITKKSSTIVQLEKSSKKKIAAELISKRAKTDVEESLGSSNQRSDKIVKPIRDTSSNLSSVELMSTNLICSIPRCFKTICPYDRKNSIKTTTAIGVDSHAVEHCC